MEYDEVTTALIVLPKETKKEDFLNGRQKWNSLQQFLTMKNVEKVKISKVLLTRRNEIKQEEAIHQECVPEEKHEARSDISNNDTDNNGVEDE